MTVLTVREVPDPVLRQVCAPVDAIDDEVHTLVTDMFETMYDAHGIGLAASQVGVLRRVVVIDLQEREIEHEPVEGSSTDELQESRADGGARVRNPHAFINPEVVYASDELSSYNEGCLSIPEQYAEVTRPARCRVRWLDERGVAHEEDMDGLMATCMQHEIDHLNGVLFLDHISRLKRDMILKKLPRRAGGLI